MSSKFLETLWKNFHHCGILNHIPVLCGTVSWVNISWFASQPQKPQKFPPPPKKNPHYTVFTPPPPLSLSLSLSLSFPSLPPSPDQPGLRCPLQWHSAGQDSLRHSPALQEQCFSESEGDTPAFSPSLPHTLSPSLFLFLAPFLNFFLLPSLFLYPSLPISLPPSLSPPPFLPSSLPPSRSLPIDPLHDPTHRF